MTPPKSPPGEYDVEVLRTISNSSSVEIVSETSSTEDLTNRMTELVQERIASLGLKPGMSRKSARMPS